MYSFLNKESSESDYIKVVYKRRVHTDIESYKNIKDGIKKDTIKPLNDLNARHDF